MSRLLCPGSPVAPCEACAADVECRLWGAITASPTPAFVASVVVLVVVSLLTVRRDPVRPLQDVAGKFTAPRDCQGIEPLKHALSGKPAAEEGSD